ncbi:hypothetical protein ABEW34_00035 [Paenibacillus algorifonticola]|uniref:hypothetical protein n=1 Tax=Paenibacillus algorifonticola TaxID=684063 RepID=UPI003D27E730
MIETLKKVARKEIEEQFFELTKQYLSVSSNATNLEKLLEGINLVPSKTWQKGTRISKRNTNRFHEASKTNNH